MRLPENGRLFVGGLSPTTGDADLRSHFRRFGEVADVCLPKDRITGRLRCFAFVQFSRPIDAARALADPYHVINGRQVYIGKAEPKHPKRSFVPLRDRIFRSRNNKCYRVGEVIRISLGPMSDDYEKNKYVNEVRKYGVIVDKTLIYDCIIGYISEDGREFMVRWPPVQRDDKFARSCQGSILPAYEYPLKSLAQLSSGGSIASNRSFGAVSPEDAEPHNWCWLTFVGP